MGARKPPREIVRWSTRRRKGNLGVTLAAIHESVGITNAWDLALFCEAKGVSYNNIADLVQMIHTVGFTDTAWHLRAGGSRSVGLCLTTPVKGYSRQEWLGPQVAKVEYAAWWLARTCSLLELPLHHCNHHQIRSALKGNKRDGGVITHNDYTLATRDGNHVDPRDFPLDVCLRWAKEIASPSISSNYAISGELSDDMPTGTLTPGTHTTKLVYPQMFSGGWVLSLASSEDGTATIWPQGDSGGTASRTEVKLAKDKRWRMPIPPKTDQITFHSTSRGSVGWCIDKV